MLKLKTLNIFFMMSIIGIKTSVYLTANIVKKQFVSIMNGSFFQQDKTVISSFPYLSFVVVYVSACSALTSRTVP